jgi:hypothetical protein
MSHASRRQIQDPQRSARLASPETIGVLRKGLADDNWSRAPVRLDPDASTAISGWLLFLLEEDIADQRNDVSPSS